MAYHISIWLFFIIMCLSLWLVANYGRRDGNLYNTVAVVFFLSYCGIVLSMIAGIIKLFLLLLGI